MAGKIVVEMSGEEQALLRSMRKVIEEQTKTEAGYKKVGRESDRAGKQAQKGFGGQAIAQLKNYALGVLSIGAATSQLAAVFFHLREEVQKAGDSIVQLAEKRRSLVQVSRTGAEFQGLEDLSDEIAKSTGMGRGEAREVVFDAKSLGFLDIVRDIAESREVITPAVASKAAGKIPEIYRGKVSPLAAINMALAAGEASAFNVEEFIQHLPTAASGGEAAGSTPAEAAGMLSVLGGQFARGSSAAERIKAFGTKVGLDKDLAGKGIMGAFDELRAMPEEKRREFLKESMELNELYMKLEQNADAIRTRTAEVQAAIDTAGTPESVLAQKRRLAMDPTTKAGRENRAQREAEKAAVAREIESGARRGVLGLESRAAFDQEMAEMDRRRAGILPGHMGWAYGKAVSGLGFGDRVTRAAVRTGETVSGAAPSAAASAVGGGLQAAIVNRLVAEVVYKLSGAATDLQGAAGELRAAGAAAGSRRAAALRERNTQRE